jgi:hypothetical protein
MKKNVSYAEVLADAPSARPLRRTPPNTLPPGLRAYPEDLVIV